MLTTAPLGKFHGQTITAYTLTNASGVKLTLMDYGATWLGLSVPTGEGAQDLLLRTDLATYTQDHAYFGKLIGRVAGRIAADQFRQAGEVWPLPANEGANTLHGGPGGFSNQLWRAVRSAADQVTFALTATPESDGFPGQMAVQVTYQLTAADDVIVTVEGTSDTATLFNPTNHAYFNFNPDDSAITTHQLRLNSHRRFELGPGKIPTGRLLDNAGTPFDFASLRPLGPALQGLAGTPEHGIDDVYLIDPHDVTVPVATVSCGAIEMRIYSDRNALVMYTSNQADPTLPLIGRTAQLHYGLVLEPQTAPSALIDPSFGDIRLPAGQVGTATWRYAFSY